MLANNSTFVNYNIKIFYPESKNLFSNHLFGFYIEEGATDASMVAPSFFVSHSPGQ